MESQGTADIRYCESSFNHTKMVIVNLFKYSVFKDITGIDISAAGRQHWRRSLMVYITTVRTSVDAVIPNKSRDYRIEQTGLTSVIHTGDLVIIQALLKAADGIICSTTVSYHILYGMLYDIDGQGISLWQLRMLRYNTEKALLCNYHKR